MSDQPSAEQAPAGQREYKMVPAEWEATARNLSKENVELRSQLAEAKEQHRGCHENMNILAENQNEYAQEVFQLKAQLSTTREQLAQCEEAYKFEVQSHRATHEREDEALVDLSDALGQRDVAEAQLSTTREIARAVYEALEEAAPFVFVSRSIATLPVTQTVLEALAKYRAGLLDRSADVGAPCAEPQPEAQNG